MQAPASIKTPKQYIANVPADRREAIQKLHDSIRKVAPELEPVIVSGMLGFGPYHYKYASGHEGDTAMVVVASQKNHISLYLCAPEEGGYLPEKNKARLGKVSVGKSCIRFKKLEDLNLPVALELVKTTAEAWKKNESATK